MMSEQEHGTHRKRTMPGVILYLCLAVTTAVAGVYTWIGQQSVQQTVAPTAPTLVMYTDSAHRFTFQYPKDWHVELGQACCEGATPDWSKQSRVVTVTPPDAPDPSAGMFIEPFTPALAQAMYNAWFNSQFDTITQIRIDNHVAYYDRLNFVGPSAAERYVDSNYLIMDTNQPLWVTFRESYYHDYPAQSWVNHDVVELKDVVGSIRFRAQ